LPKGNGERHEIIILAIKPNDGSYVDNALKWGVAGLNLKDTRIGNEPVQINKLEVWSGFGQKDRPDYTPTQNIGRFPSNVVLNEESAKMLDEQKSGASRFFYCPKASVAERGTYNNHISVKPLALIEYLVKLTSMPSPDQVYLDPFLGSGTTAIAVRKLGKNFIGIEINEEYIRIAEKRIQEYFQSGKEKKK
jgi:site-specific DNA-methyltransferase (adenine-specific)